MTSKEAIASRLAVAEALEEAANKAEVLKAEVHEAIRASKAARLGSIIAAVNSVLMVLVLLSSVYVGYRLYDCLAPNGTCAKRGAKTTAAAIVNIEVSRNQTELERARERGDQKDVEFRERKVGDLKAQANAILTSR